LKSEDFRAAVGQQFLGDFIGIDTSAPRSDSAAGFVAAFNTQFGRAPSGPGLPNSFDATAIALLAYHAAGRAATGAEIAAQVPRVTDPAGEAIPATVAGFTRAMAVLSAGGTVSYQGGTGAVSFDQYGDVSAPAVTWNFDANGVVEQRYIPLEEVAAFTASLN
jgi:hypothetical protein